MKVKVFTETAGTFDERDILKKFYKGIKKHENTHSDNFVDNVEVSFGIQERYDPCDVAVMLGSWKDRDRPWHNTRNSVVKNARVFIVVETPFLDRKTSEKNTQHRIGVNGFLSNDGIFTIKNYPADRLNNMGLTWQGWKNNKEGHVLLMLQLPGDASLRGIDMYDWARWALDKIKQHTDRKIIIRTHPHHNPKELDVLHKFISDITLMEDPNIKVRIGNSEATLQKDLKDAYCSVSYSSGSSIDSILAGVPTIALDPANFAYGVSNNFIEEIENLRYTEEAHITQWLSNLAYSQWSVEEMENGTVWRHVKPIIDAQLVQAVARGKKK